MDEIFGGSGVGVLQRSTNLCPSQTAEQQHAEDQLPATQSTHMPQIKQGREPIVFQSHVAALCWAERYLIPW